jgi:hypothetical protein
MVAMPEKHPSSALLGSKDGLGYGQLGFAPHLSSATIAQMFVHCVSQQLPCCQVSHTHLRTPSSQCFSRTSCTHIESQALVQQSGSSAQMHFSTASSAQPPLL